MGNEAKQRFIDLDVSEVSVVDSPANESDFVVIKSLTNNMEVGEMAKEQNEQQVTAQAEQVKVEVEAPATDAVSKAMEQVTNLVDSIAKATNAGAPAASSGEEGPTAEEAEAKTEKSENSDNTEENAAAATSGMIDEAVAKALDGVFQGLQKARTFTPNRESTLKAAIEALVNLAKELGMKEIPVGQSPATNTPSGTQFGASGTQQLTKALEGFQSLAKSLEGLQDVTKGLAERLEKVEKTRNPSVALSNEGGEGGEANETETQKSLWKGVL